MTDWLALEQAEAKRDGARPVSNSGRGHKEKGDARLGNFTIDYKMSAKQVTITKKMWAKVCSDATRNTLSDPALKLVIGEEDGPKTRLWVIDDTMFALMLEAYKEKYEV